MARLNCLALFQQKQTGDVLRKQAYVERNFQFHFRRAERGADGTQG